MDYELIESYQEVVENVRQFNQGLATGKDICSQLSQFRAWYYIPELDALGPSKFIGYKGMNTSRYQWGDEKDGRETERRLQKFFRPIDESHHCYAYLEDKLLIITAQCGKKPNKQARLNVPRGF
ncbi:MAG: hypothetical protein DDT29_02286 [Dehalococcoidia bacterium]|nr:hypothetical protein [Bacillota bacterium]